MARYAELHCHTNYSFLDGASHPAELAMRAAELGYTALGITDHDGFRGAVKVHQAARTIGMPVVYGTEIGLPRNHPPSEGIGEHSEPRGVARPRRGRIRRMHGSRPVGREPTDHLVLI